MKDALRPEQDAGAVFLEELVFGFGGINFHFVFKARAAAFDDFDAQPAAVYCPGEQLADLCRGALGDGYFSSHSE